MLLFWAQYFPLALTKWCQQNSWLDLRSESVEEVSKSFLYLLTQLAWSADVRDSVEIALAILNPEHQQGIGLGCYIIDKGAFKHTHWSFYDCTFKLNRSKMELSDHNCRCNAFNQFTYSTSSHQVMSNQINMCETAQWSKDSSGLGEKLGWELVH